MTTLVQIESAVAELPAQDQLTLLAWLQKRVQVAPQMPVAEPDALKIFRQLQEEVALTREGATAWKNAVIDGRR